MGGNVFKGQTTSIPRERIMPTLTRYFSELAEIFPNKQHLFNLDNFVLLGSAGKKAISGDIDLGIDSTLIFGVCSDEDIGSWGINPAMVEEETQALQKRARTATEAQSRKKAFFKLLCQHINVHAAKIYCDEGKVSEGNIFSLFPQYDENENITTDAVQIDWMCGNIEWLKFSYYSSEYPPESNVKGLCRTQLLLSAFQVADLSFNHLSGVKDKTTGEIVATNPTQALQVLNTRLGTDITNSDAENYYRLYDKLHLLLDFNQYDKLLNTYLKILDSTRVDIPDNLQESWKQKKSQLGLTGKFLPASSLLVGN